MHRPELAADALGPEVGTGGRLQVVVQPHEVEGRPDPRDARDHMQPAAEQVEPVEGVGVHFKRDTDAPPANASGITTFFRTGEDMPALHTKLLERLAKHNHDEQQELHKLQLVPMFYILPSTPFPLLNLPLVSKLH